MRSESWIRKNARSLKGKTAAITGSTGGLGREICRYIAELGGSLVLLDRNPERSEAHARELEDLYGVSVTTLTTDLTVPESVKCAARELKKIAPDFLILNGAVYAVPRFTCEGGHDNIFQTNFLSHYYLVSELMPVLREKKGRVVAVGSIAYRYSETDPADPEFLRVSGSSKVYGNSKRCLMFSLYGLFRNETDVSLAVAHPGISFTGITAHYPKWLFAIIKYPMKVIFMKPKRACLSIVDGLFEPCSECEWIGPRFFDVWGTPKKKRIRGVDEAERERIFSQSNEILRDFAQNIG